MNDLPSRQRITNAEDVVTKLDETAVRSGILENLTDVLDRAVARALIGGGGGGCIFIYSCYARRISFEISCF